jgi:Putative Flp pilus-assembly TadE/G-like
VASRRLCRRWRPRLGAERGQVLVLLTLTLPMMLGISAIVVDVGRLFVERRSLQQAADAAALAAAQRLPGTVCDATCTTDVADIAGDYKGKNLEGFGGPALPVCDAVTTSNCYRILGPPSSPDRVEVIVTENVPTLFGAILGKKSFDVRARAVAKTFAHTSVQPGSTVTNPGSTYPGSVSVTTVTTPGADVPALMFAKSSTCFAINLNGAGADFNGAVVSNGGVDAPSNNMGGGPLITANPPGCGADLGNGNSWGAPIERPPADWPVPPPLCTTATSAPGVNACTPSTAAAGQQITTVGGVPCTAAPANWTINSAPAPGLYCSSGSVDIRANFSNVGIVAPTIHVRGVVVSGTNLLPSYGGLVFYAYGGIAGTNEQDTVSVVAGSGSGTYTGSTGSVDLMPTPTRYGSITRTCSTQTTPASCQDVLSATDTITLGALNITSTGSSPGTRQWTFTLLKNGSTAVGSCTTPVGTAACTINPTQTFGPGDTAVLAMFRQVGTNQPRTWNFSTSWSRPMPPVSSFTLTYNSTPKTIFWTQDGLQNGPSGALTAAAFTQRLSELTGAGTVSAATRTGSGTAASPYAFQFSFQGSLARTNVPDLTVSASGLTASITTNTQGAPDSATSSAVVDQSGGGYAFKGAIYAPFGHADMTGSGNQALCPTPGSGCGFLEAWTIRLAGAGADWQGLGPGQPGAGTVSTTTTTIPGTTTAGSTVTNPDVTVTVSTGSNLEE